MGFWGDNLGLQRYLVSCMLWGVVSLEHLVSSPDWYLMVRGKYQQESDIFVRYFENNDQEIRVMVLYVL